MLDKIMLSKETNTAVLIFTNRSPITLSTDQDITLFLLWFLDSPLVYAFVNNGLFHIKYLIEEEEITQVTKVDGAA